MSMGSVSDFSVASEADDYTILSSTITPGSGGWATNSTDPRTLAPLTTIFTYESECIGRWTLSTDMLIFDLKPTGAQDNGWRFCQPLDYKRTYSPGLCPSGYRFSRASMVQLIASNSAVREEWGAICCPRCRGFDIGNHDFLCTGFIHTPVQVQVDITLTSIYSDPLGALITGIGYTTTWTSLSSATALVEPLEMRWQKSDLSLFPQTYATSLAKRMGVEFMPATSTSASTKTSADLPEETSKVSTGQLDPAIAPQLNAGKKAGIGVGIAIFIVLSVLLIAALLNRCHRYETRVILTQGTANATPEMEDQEQKQGRKWYLGGKWRNEVEVKPTPGELSTSIDPHELCATGPEPRELDSRSVRSPVELEIS